MPFITSLPITMIFILEKGIITMSINETTEIEEFDLMRKVIAYKTSQSWEEVPHVSYIYEPDITDFYAEYKKLAGKMKVTLNTIMLKIITEGLLAAPDLNAHIEYSQEKIEGCITRYKDVSISVPSQMPNGMMIPLTVHKVNELSLNNITEHMTCLEAKAGNTHFNELNITSLRESEDQPIERNSEALTKNDITGATVTVSNIGSLYKKQKGYFSLLEIVPPQVFVVGIGALQEIPGIYVDESGSKHIGIRKTLPMCLVFDHRAVNFSALVPFLKKLDEIFACPKVIHEW